MTKTAPNRRPPTSEEGYVMVAVMFLLFLLVISMTIAGPIIKKQIQHDREIETMHRGRQYVRAIKMYYKKFGGYPPNLDALVNTNQIHFLRKKYTDPTTGKADWKLIHMGENKVPTAWGFFGQPLTASTMAGVGPSGPGGIGVIGQNGASGALGANTTGIGGAGTAGPGSSNSGTPTPGSTDPNSPAPNGPTGTSGTDPATGSTGTAGTSTGAAGTGTGLSGQTGQTFGGAGIIGVEPNSPKQSILLRHKKNHYNEWEFVYDPLAEQMQMQGGNTGNNGLGGNAAGGSSIGGNGIGGNGAGGIGAGSSSGGAAGSGAGTGPGSGTSPPQQQ
jgi:type II secretory pathway pseudopilin PulG